MNILRRKSIQCAALLLTLFPTSNTRAASLYLGWSQLYRDDTPGLQQVPTAIAFDARGNVFVTGWQTVGTGKGLYVTKYDSLDGHPLWSRSITPAGSNEFIPNDIVVDSQGDCIVTGSRNAGGIDYYTRKFDGTTGADGWNVGAVTFQGGNSGEDTALKVVVDGDDNIIVTGRSSGVNLSDNPTGFDWVTIKYRASDGFQLFTDSYSQTTTNLNDVPAGLAVDASDNVYIAGTVMTAPGESRLYLRKLNGATFSKAYDIVPIDTGTLGVDSEGGATGLAVKNNVVVVTGIARDLGNHFGYYTAKFSTSSNVRDWESFGPYSQEEFGPIPRPQPVGVVIGPDDRPIVTGTLRDADGNYGIRTVKYNSDSASEFWDEPSFDTGLSSDDTIRNTFARAIATDGAGNAIVVGDAVNKDGHSDLYIAKYDAQTGKRVFFTTFNGSTTSSQDKGVDVAVDHFGNVAALGNLIASKGGAPGAGSSEFGTFKLNRLITPTGDELPDQFTGVPENAVVKIAGTPAIGDNGALATKLTFKAGSKSGDAILVEQTAAGGVDLPAVKGQPAPVAPGDPAVNWVSFSDPIMAPNGAYAFAAKVSGTGAKANGVWADLDGNGLKLIFRQGSTIPVAGSTEKFASLMNMGIESNNLIALVKLAGPGSRNLALIRVDQHGVGTLLLQKGVTPVSINSVSHNVTGITIFTPGKTGADGRWQGSTGVVARVTGVDANDPKKKATAIFSISNAGAKTAFAFAGKASPISGSNYSVLSFPATAFGTLRFAFKTTLTPGVSGTSSALIYSSTGASFNAFAQKNPDVPTGVTGLPDSVSFSDFSDPIVNTNSRVAFIGTLKGPSNVVKGSTNKIIAFGDPLTTLTNVARTGDIATDASGDPSAEGLKWTAFSALALPGGLNAGPIFVGKLGTSKNNLGLWARTSDGSVRQLLRLGDDYDGKTVKKFTLLNTVQKVMTAPRSFDGTGSVAVFLNFSDGTTAIRRIGIP